MKVRELLALLADADPDDTLLLDKKSGNLLLLRVRSGMHQPLQEDVSLRLNEDDLEFLRALHIK